MFVLIADMISGGTVDALSKSKSLAENKILNERLLRMYFSSHSCLMELKLMEGIKTTYHE